MIKLTPHFLEELFKLLTLKKTLLTICQQHLKYQHIPKEYGEFKIILKSFLTQFENTGKLPTLGVTSQQNIKNIEIQEAISRIKQTDIVDEEQMIVQLEKFIKGVEFQAMTKKSFELWQADKQEEAIELSTKESERINRISLRRDGNKIVKVFGDFHKENDKRKSENIEDSGEKKSKVRVPFGIDPIDDIAYGGAEEGDLAMWIFRSGDGKSTAAKWTGMNAALLGYDVLHIQLEDTAQKCRDKYAQIFTRQDFINIKNGSIPREAMIAIDKFLKQVEKRKNDIEIYAFEQLNKPTMIEIREVVMDYQSRHGKFPDFVIIDSLNLAATGENKKIDNDPDYKKERLKRVAEMMKNLAVEFKTRILTTMQTGDIPIEKWDDPSFYITRSNTEGDRTLIQPFDFVFTGNRTLDEVNGEMARIYVDKVRYHKPKNQKFPIYTNYSKGAFYDREKTLKNLYNI